MEVPLNQLARGIGSRRSEIRAAFDRVLASGRLVMGAENEALEQELNDFLGVEHSILVGNGTDALEIALTTLGVAQDAPVLTVANAGGYAAAAIRQVGARPVYVDVSPDSLQMSIDSLKTVLAGLPEKPAAIVVTHLYGKAAPIEGIISAASAHNVPVIEDCAQSLGATVSGQRLGSFGQLSTTSFYPTKNLGALGDGGAIFTSSSGLASKAKALRQYGWARRYEIELPGGRNSRLDELQAAVLRLRLPDLDRSNLRRRELHREFRAVDSSFGVLPHAYSEDFVAHLCVMVSDRRDVVRSALKKKGIATDIHYPIPDHLQLPYRDKSSEPLPVTEAMAGRVLSLPLFPEMSEEEVGMVLEGLSG